MDEAETPDSDPFLEGTPCKADWMAGTTDADWLLDGATIKATGFTREAWDGLDWSKAYVDMGPSLAGNPGPYWHVPYPAGETVHRLYPKLLRTKWLPVVRQAVDEIKGKQALPALTPEA